MVVLRSHSCWEAFTSGLLLADCFENDPLEEDGRVLTFFLMKPATKKDGQEL
jgi:hypothetical protein